MSKNLYIVAYHGSGYNPMGGGETCQARPAGSLHENAQTHIPKRTRGN